MPGGATRSLALVLGLLAALALAASVGAQPARITAVVGPGFNISISKGGQRLATVAAGRYTVAVADHSNIHNFHLKGPGVDKDSGVWRTGSASWTVTLRPGRYTIVCDPHASPMQGSFTVR